jgi:hypothetical protein
MGCRPQGLAACQPMKRGSGGFLVIVCWRLSTRRLESVLLVGGTAVQAQRDSALNYKP